VSIWREDLFLHPETALSRPLVASSACLLGEAVRYDGGHKYQANIEQLLLPSLQLQAICPEVDIGLGIPRPTLDGISTPKGVRILESNNHSVDVTDSLVELAQNHVDQCGPFWPLCGYIFKARSPSCGAGSLVIDPHLDKGETAWGAFAGHIHQQMPWLLLYEEEDLQSEQACEDLLLLTFICRDILWQRSDPNMAALLSHYSELLGPLAVEEDVMELWMAVRELLGRDNKKRRKLIAQFRAV
jgi:uncharacterized protein YbbK (DUF523 family)